MANLPVLLAVSHGTSSPLGSIAISQLVAAVRRAAPDVELAEAYVDVQQPDVPTALAALGDREVVIVPLLLSAGYHLRVDIARAARQAGDHVSVAAAMGPDRRLARVLARRIASVPKTAADISERQGARQQIVLCAAGSSDHGASEACQQMAELLAEETTVDVSAAFLSAAEPALPDLLDGLPSPHDCIVATYLLATGYFDRVAGEHCGKVAGLRRTLPLLVADEDPPAELVELVLDRYKQAISR